MASGAGAAALACTDLLVDTGLPVENIWVTDLAGVVYAGRTELMDPEKARFAQKTDKRKLGEVIDGADIFPACRRPACSSRTWCSAWPTSRWCWHWPTPIRKSCRNWSRRCVPTR